MLISSIEHMSYKLRNRLDGNVGGAKLKQKPSRPDLLDEYILLYLCLHHL